MSDEKKIENIDTYEILHKRRDGDEKMFDFHDTVMNKAEDLDLGFLVMVSQKGKDNAAFFCNDVEPSAIFSSVTNILRQHPDEEVKTAIIGAVLTFLGIEPPTK